MHYICCRFNLHIMQLLRQQVYLVKNTDPLIVEINYEFLLDQLSCSYFS